MQGGLCDDHLTGIAFEEEIHIVHIPADIGQVHTGEMILRTQIGEVFRMHADQL